MGLLRFLLAISVILAHTPSGNIHGISLVGGPVAVEAFFIISGFYITLILNEKYIKANNSYWLFISNRFLRLFPFYWIVLLLTITCSLFINNFNSAVYVGGLGMYQKYGSHLDLSAWFYLVFTHLFIFFQDVAMFLGIDVKLGNLFFTSNFNNSHPQLYRFLLLPQAWSIGLELIFYLIAPFLVRRKTGVIVGFILASMLLKSYFITHGLDNDPWTYRFFPFELMYFLLGTLGYIIYKRFIETQPLPKYLGTVLYVGVAIFTICFSSITIKLFYFVYLFSIFIAIPILFKHGKKFKVDRFLGELSYPIYLIHLLVINITETLGITAHAAIIEIFVTIILSVIFIKFIGDKIELLRQGRIIKQKGITTEPDALSVKFSE